MKQKIKLIWDFKGPDALATAKHHCIHLREFSEMEKLKYYTIDHKELHEMHTIAFLIVDEVYMKVFRDALRPHRGELAD